MEVVSSSTFEASGVTQHLQLHRLNTQCMKGGEDEVEVEVPYRVPEFLMKRANGYVMGLTMVDQPHSFWHMHDSGKFHNSTCLSVASVYLTSLNRSQPTTGYG